MLSISTSWNHSEDMDVKAWLKKIKSFGLNAIELGYTISKEQLSEFEKWMSEFDIHVSSIHNFCPTPDDHASSRHASNYYRLSSLDDAERQKAVEWTKVCIDTAARVQSAVVVIHAGTLELTEDPSEVLFELYRSGKTNTEEFKNTRDQLVKLREDKKGPYIDVLEESLKEVMLYAKENNIQIGLETRYYPIEIPNFEEVGYFLDRFSDMGMSYWHDVGHAEVNERLGISHHLDFLKKYQGQMIGIHLHGMKKLRDHLAAFDGDMDLEKVFPYLKPEMIRVIESRFASEDQIKMAVAKLQNI